MRDPFPTPEAEEVSPIEVSRSSPPEKSRAGRSRSMTHMAAFRLSHALKRNRIKFLATERFFLKRCHDVVSMRVMLISKPGIPCLGILFGLVLPDQADRQCWKSGVLRGPSACLDVKVVAQMVWLLSPWVYLWV
jgi:hypothetical protein